MGHTSKCDKILKQYKPKKVAPTLKAMEVDRLKEAVKFIGRMGVLMSAGASGSGMFEWWEEVPTLTPEQESYQM